MTKINRAEMFNRKAASSNSESNRIIKILNIKRGENILDIGSGGGYFSMRFASETGLDGTVYATDVNKQFLDYIDNKTKENGFNNIKTILINDKIKGITKESCDLIFMRNVYHHLNNTENYFKDLKHLLKPEGRIVIIDYKKTKNFSFINLLKHYIKEEYIISCLRNSGYEHEKSYNFLKQQSFNIFKIK